MLLSQTLTRWPLKALLAAGALLLSDALLAQVFSITQGTVNTCTGILLDSGGQGGSGYGNNENYTVVICPDNPGDVISLVWTTFNLDQTGPNPLDRIRLWDGNSTAATFLGEYTGNQLQGLTTQATTFNTTGCLTVQFISNANGTGIFAASITCETPCDRPTAEATMSQGAVPALICVGEEITFDGSASFPAPGFTIASYTWDFADGTTANTPVASHSWSEPGEYVVQLYLLDDNDCANTNLVDFQVLVSTTPSFQGTIESSETCLGASVDLSAVVTPTTWTGVPDNNFGPPVYLPDNLGIPFTSDIVFTQFAPGQTLTDINDIFEVCVNMEHSFMGDLVISLTCPNGQNVIFHQQGGGGTDLGIPGPGSALGTCWEYCWSPTATNGTWVQNSGGGSLPSGTYSSLQPMSQLEGCPMNGTWTITFVDLWAADDGWLCDWQINVNPAIIPDVTQFTPVLGTTVSDSAWWSGPNLVFGSDPLNASANNTAPGDYNYTFTVIDNFGCSYDTTITITVLPPIEIDAGPAIVLCSDPLPMAGQITANGPPTDCQWTLTLFESFGDGWNGGANLQVIIDGVATTYSITAFNVLTQSHVLQVSTGSSIVLQYTAGTIWNNENSFSLTNDQGVVVYASPNGPPTGVAWSGTATCDGGTSAAVYQWTPATGLDDPSDPLTNVFVTQPTWFTLSVWPDGFPQCAVTDSVLVSPDPSIDAGENNTIIICETDPVFLLADSLGGTPDAGGVWTTSTGAVVPNSFDPDSGAPGVYTYTVTSAANCVASAELDITILPADDPQCCGVPIASQQGDLYSCDLSIALSATPGNTGVGNWSGPAVAQFSDAFSPQCTVTMPPGSGGSHWFYWIENDGAFCNLKDSVLVTFTDEIVITFDNTNAICYTYCDGTASASITGGNAATDFIYVWSNGTAGQGTSTLNGLCAGDYSLTVSDDNGCEASADFTILEPVLLEIDLITTTPVTCSGDCDGTVVVTDPEAVEYSYNGGASWTTQSTWTTACEGTYNIEIRDAAGCIGIGSATVTGPPPVMAAFDWGPIPANVNNPTIFFTNESEHAERYLWNFDGLATSTEVDPVYQFTNTEPGNYLVCLAAYNFNDCADTVCYTVVIDDVLFTYVPNAFTPDGDGVNDGFMMSTNIPVITSFNMLVFDRWGQVVFETNDPYNAWRGSYRNSGAILATGVYAYRIQFEIAGVQARRELTGHVTLLR